MKKLWAGILALLLLIGCATFGEVREKDVWQEIKHIAKAEGEKTDHPGEYLAVRVYEGRVYAVSWDTTRDWALIEMLEGNGMYVVMSIPNNPNKEMGDYVEGIFIDQQLVVMNTLTREESLVAAKKVLDDYKKGTKYTQDNKNKSRGVPTGSSTEIVYNLCSL